MCSTVWARELVLINFISLQAPTLVYGQLSRQMNCIQQITHTSRCPTQENKKEEVSHLNARLTQKLTYILSSLADWFWICFRVILWGCCGLCGSRFSRSYWCCNGNFLWWRFDCCYWFSEGMKIKIVYENCVLLWCSYIYSFDSIITQIILFVPIILWMLVIMSPLSIHCPISTKKPQV